MNYYSRSSPVRNRKNPPLGFLIPTQSVPGTVNNPSRGRSRLKSSFNLEQHRGIATQRWQSQSKAISDQILVLDDDCYYVPDQEILVEDDSYEEQQQQQQEQDEDEDDSEDKHMQNKDQQQQIQQQEQRQQNRSVQNQQILSKDKNKIKVQEYGQMVQIYARQSRQQQINQDKKSQRESSTHRKHSQTSQSQRSQQSQRQQQSQLPNQLRQSQSLQQSHIQQSQPQMNKQILRNYSFGDKQFMPPPQVPSVKNNREPAILKLVNFDRASKHSPSLLLSQSLLNRNNKQKQFDSKHADMISRIQSLQIQKIQQKQQHGDNQYQKQEQYKDQLKQKLQNRARNVRNNTNNTNSNNARNIKIKVKKNIAQNNNSVVKIEQQQVWSKIVKNFIRKRGNSAPMLPQNSNQIKTETQNGIQVRPKSKSKQNKNKIMQSNINISINIQKQQQNHNKTQNNKIINISNVKQSKQQKQQQIRQQKQQIQQKQQQIYVRNDSQSKLPTFAQVQQTRIYKGKHINLSFSRKQSGNQIKIDQQQDAHQQYSERVPRQSNAKYIEMRIQQQQQIANDPLFPNNQSHQYPQNVTIKQQHTKITQSAQSSKHQQQQLPLFIHSTQLLLRTIHQLPQKLQPIYTAMYKELQRRNYQSQTTIKRMQQTQTMLKLLIHAHRKYIYVDHYLLNEQQNKQQYEHQHQYEHIIQHENEVSLNEKIVINREIIMSLVRKLAILYQSVQPQ